MFYIIGSNKSTTSVIYTGLFKIYDDKGNVNDLNDASDKQNSNPSIIPDTSLAQETATVTKKQGVPVPPAPIPTGVSQEPTGENKTDETN